MYRRTA